MTSEKPLNEGAVALAPPCDRLAVTTLPAGAPRSSMTALAYFARRCEVTTGPRSPTAVVLWALPAADNFTQDPGTSRWQLIAKLHDHRRAKSRVPRFHFCSDFSRWDWAEAHSSRSGAEGTADPAAAVTARGAACR